MLTNPFDTEEFEEEFRSALVCEDRADLRSVISSALEGLQYVSEFASSAEDAFEKLRFNEYGLIILNERFCGSTPETNAVYSHLQTMLMSIRRHIFLALVSNDLKSADNMTAFAKSVNVVVNEKDLPQLKAILKKSIADNDHFYKVFRESLIKMGKR